MKFFKQFRKLTAHEMLEKEAEQVRARMIEHAELAKYHAGIRDAAEAALLSLMVNTTSLNKPSIFGDLDALAKETEELLDSIAPGAGNFPDISPPEEAGAKRFLRTPTFEADGSHAKHCQCIHCAVSPQRK